MNFSRREFLAILTGGCGAVAACAGGGLGLGGLLYLFSERHERDVVVVTGAPTAQEIAVNPDSSLHVVPRADWGALEPNHLAENEFGFYSQENLPGWYTYEGDLRDVYTTLVLHHSVIDEGSDLDTLLEIQNLHRTDRKWADVGYHYFVGKEGAIYEGRPLNVRGAHVAGYNTGSVGVCLLGNFMEKLPTQPQIEATSKIIGWLNSALLLSHLAPHRAFNTDTLCPGDNLLPYLEEFATNNGLSVGTAGYIQPTSTPSASYCCCCHI